MELITRAGQAYFIDDEDFEKIKNFSWHVIKSPYTMYVSAMKKEYGKPYTAILLHRLVMGASKGMEVDHINGNGLDNRKINLRMCSQSQNQANRQKTSKHMSSKFKGVYWCKRQKRWVAKIDCNSKRHYIGSFVNETDAAVAYNKKSAELFGDFSRINEIGDFSLKK